MEGQFSSEWVFILPPLSSEWLCLLATSQVQLDSPAGPRSSRNLFFLRRSPITSLYFRSSNHISSQSEIKKFACHLLISFLSVKQPSKTCFLPLERSKLQWAHWHGGSQTRLFFHGCVEGPQEGHWPTLRSVLAPNTWSILSYIRRFTSCLQKVFSPA